MKLALDLYCCQGGASHGLAAAGFRVVGVDIVEQPNYPFPFIRADAITTLPRGFDFVWASPPCQSHTLAQRIQGREHPDLIEPTRAMLRASGIPYVIENVVGAPLENPIMTASHAALAPARRPGARSPSGPPILKNGLDPVKSPLLEPGLHVLGPSFFASHRLFLI
jgi:hypothetical protein